MRLAAYAISLLLIALSFSACSRKKKELEESEENALSRKRIESTLARYYQDFSDRNWLAFATHFWEGAVLTTVWQKPSESAEDVHYTTIPEFIAKAPEGPDSQPIFEEKMVKSDIKVEGGLAQAWVFYEAKFGSEDSLYHWEGIDAITLIRFNNQWKIASIAYMSRD
ncbi:nuclear transport factor 2 family protein [Fulvivirgaceae bacterium BMA12]|uniref:Nuclear transport factor 2 family protein n=1 Tax=Agaribacillus aureus TaxID=3051825 RepID=A0ABT8L4Y9_9BACT|nr:nuclear transport factor 2 family protein [Fulvivirgaceae bacterium BMA12]